MGGPAPATVPDVPLAWRRIADRAEEWPNASAAVERGRTIELPTIPASGVRDAIGLNIDSWRQEGGTRDWTGVLTRVRELGVRHARVNLSATGGAWGLERLRTLGRAGVRLDLVMGDAFGRFGTAPYATLDRRLGTAGILPFVDSLEGTNEPDLADRDGWARAARTHQERVAASLGSLRATPIALVAPSVGRLDDARDLRGVGSRLADAMNIHPYAGGR